MSSTVGLGNICEQKWTSYSQLSMQLEDAPSTARMEESKFRCTQENTFLSFSFDPTQICHKRKGQEEYITGAQQQ